MRLAERVEGAFDRWRGASADATRGGLDGRRAAAADGADD